MPRWMKRSDVVSLALSAIACFVSLAALGGQVQTQNSSVLSTRIAELKKQIDSQDARHAGAERLGTLWLTLADAYQQELDLHSAEDAFGHALGLLRATGANALYANALDGIATVYFATGRMDAADKCLRKALELEHTRGD